MSIHPQAIVESGAKIGHDVEVGPCAYIGSNVVLGDACRIHHHATVEGHTTLGPRCEVYPQAVIGSTPQDLKYAGEVTTLDIGPDNIFREMVTAHPGTANGGGATEIGSKNLFLIGVHVAHDCKIGNDCVFANYVQFAGHVVVEDNVNMGGHSAVHHFVTIGKHAFIGGMTRVSADVPPFMVVVAARGSRSEVRMVNGVGLQRSGYSEDDISAIKAAFMKLYSRRARSSGTPIRDRVEAIQSDPDVNASVEYLCSHLMRSFAHGRHGRYLESLRADPTHRKTWKLEGADRPMLTVNIDGRGTVSRKNGDSDSTGGFDVIHLTASADAGWSFAGWDGNLSGQANPMRVVVDRPMHVTATFTEAPS